MDFAQADFCRKCFHSGSGAPSFQGALHFPVVTTMPTRRRAVDPEGLAEIPDEMRQAVLEMLLAKHWMDSLERPGLVTDDRTALFEYIWRSFGCDHHSFQSLASREHVRR